MKAHKWNNELNNEYYVYMTTERMMNNLDYVCEYWTYNFPGARDPRSEIRNLWGKVTTRSKNLFFVQKQHETHTVNSWVHWQTWKRHWGILAVQKHNETEQTNKTWHSTIAMRQNLISDDFSLDLFLLANHANIPPYIAYVMTITLQYSTNECLKKEFHPNSTAVRMDFQHLILTLDVRG